MPLKIKSLLVTTILSLSSLTYASSRLEEIDEALEKISAYRQQGLKSAELDEQEKKLLQEKKKLDKEKKKKNLVKSQTENAPTYKKFRPQDYLRFINKLENASERLAAITAKLIDERGALSNELSNENKNSQKIAELRDKIDILEWEKTKVEASIAKVSLSNDLTKFKIGGIFDFYYGHSSNSGGDANGTPTPDDNSDNSNSYRYYDNQHNEFTVNLVELSFAASLERTSFFLELDFGEFAEQNAPGDEVTKHIGQAFLTHDFDGMHSVAAGKMYTHVGFELAKPIDNWNYSRSYAFGFGGPFWHEGIALKGNYSNGMRAGLFVYDTTDARRSKNDEKTYGAQLGWANEKLTLIYNFIGGAEGQSNGKKRMINELNAQFNFSDSLAFALDLVSGNDDRASDNGKDYSWQGVVGYLKYNFADTWRLALRSELFSETTPDSSSSFKLSPASKGTDITSHTVTFAKILTERNELRLEFRHDKSTEAIYYNEQGDLRESQDTVTAAWVIGL